MRRNSEEQHAANAEREQFARFGDGAVDGEARDPGHRRDRAGVRRPLGDEERRDETVEGDAVLAHERADGLGPPQPARTDRR